MGLAGCAEQPVDCNSGDRADGGTVTWLLSGPWATYNVLRLEGADASTAAALAGTAPCIGDFQPDGAWAWNRDLLASDPRSRAPRRRPWSTSSAPRRCGATATPSRSTTSATRGSTRAAARTSAWAATRSTRSAGRTSPASRAPTTAGPSRSPWRMGRPTRSGSRSSSRRRTRRTSRPRPGSTGAPPRGWARAPSTSVTPCPPGRAARTSSTASSQASGRDGPEPQVVRQGRADARRDRQGGRAPEVGAGGAERRARRRLTEVRPGRLRPAQPAGGLQHLDRRRRDVGPPRPEPAVAPLQDLALREAIFTAIDTADARTRIFGAVEPALRTNHFFPSSSPHHEDLLEDTGFGSGDAEAARELLIDAGYTGAEPGERLTKDGAEVPALRFAFGAENQSRATFVELVQSYLAELGIEITPQAVPGAGFGQTLGGGDFDLAVWSLSSGPLFTNAPSQFFHSESPVNFNGLSDPAIDEAALGVLSHADVDDAADAANAVDERIMAQAFNLPLWDTPAFAFASDRLVDVRDNTSSYVRAMYAMQAWGIRPD